MSPYRQAQQSSPTPPPKREPWRRTLIEHAYCALFIVGPIALFVGACDAASLRAFGAAAAPISSAVVAVAPVVDHALAAHQARARELAPTLPAGDPRLDDVARRLAALEATKLRERAADTCEASAPNATALVLALEEAARAKADATRARGALAAALRALPVVDAGTDGGER